MLGIEFCDRHSGRYFRLFYGYIVGAHFEITVGARTTVRQAVNGETEIRQHLIVDDVVEENSVGIKGFLVENDAFAKRFFFLDSESPKSWLPTL